MLLAFAFGVSLQAHAKLCQSWAQPELLGHLDPKFVNESSGMAASRGAKVLYHINDSGSPPEFYVSDLNGEHTRKIAVSDFTLEDTEDMALGPCPLSSKRCLALGDIGDNNSKRKSIKVVFLEEQVPFPDRVKPQATRYFIYPNGPHDAESMAILPNGDLIIITKEMNFLNGKPSQIFRSRKSDYAEKSEKNPILLEKVADLYAGNFTHDKMLGSVVTGMSVTSDGSKFVLLTYGTIIEFNVDLRSTNLNPQSWRENIDYKVLAAPPLAQQESITFDDQDKSIIYSTELANFGLGSKQSVPIMRIQCVR
jgi:hypothetical protein